MVGLDFNEVLTADIMWVDTVNKKGCPALNMVEAASTYQVVAPLTNSTSEEVSRAMVDGWFRCG